MKSADAPGGAIVAEKRRGEQEEVRKGRVEVGKVRGDLNPADLMTKILSMREIEDRLAGMNIRVRRTKVS